MKAFKGYDFRLPFVICGRKENENLSLNISFGGEVDTFSEFQNPLMLLTRLFQQLRQYLLCVMQGIRSDNCAEFAYFIRSYKMSDGDRFNPFTSFRRNYM